MELVEGKTLRELLDEGPLSTETMLPLATQIAEGLAASDKAEKELEAAKATLEETGWKPGPDGIRVNKDGKRLELKMWAKNESTYRRVAEVVGEDEGADPQVGRDRRRRRQGGDR